MTKSVAIIDGGGANIASLQYALQRLGADSHLTSDSREIEESSHVILPGVGAAAPAMAQIHQKELANVILNLKQPVLGICLGMQLMGTSSAEDNVDCLGVFPDKAIKLKGGPESPVPNMGWCRVTFSSNNPLLQNIPDASWFYFVHSYVLPVSQRTLARTSHTHDFSAILKHNNFYATQFHPERSAAAGAQLLKNFMKLN